MNGDISPTYERPSVGDRVDIDIKDIIFITLTVKTQWGEPLEFTVPVEQVTQLRFFEEQLTGALSGDEVMHIEVTE